MARKKTVLVSDRIVETAEGIHSKILRKQKPTMNMPIRSLSNVKYHARKGYFEMLGKNKQRTLTVGTVKTFAQALKMMALSKELYPAPTLKVPVGLSFTAISSTIRSS